MDKEVVNNRTYKLALNTIKLINSLNKSDYVHNIIGKQLVRSVTSIGANIIEAQSGCSRKDFTNFLNYSLKSANESQFWFRLLNNTNRNLKVLISELLEETKQLADILAASILTLKGKRKKYY